MHPQEIPPGRLEAILDARALRGWVQKDLHTAGTLRTPELFPQYNLDTVNYNEENINDPWYHTRRPDAHAQCPGWVTVEVGVPSHVHGGTRRRRETAAHGKDAPLVRPPARPRRERTVHRGRFAGARGHRRRIQHGISTVRLPATLPIFFANVTSWSLKAETFCLGQKAAAMFIGESHLNKADSLRALGRARRAGW